MSKILIIEDSQPLVAILTKKIILSGIDCEFIIQTGKLSREEIASQILDIAPDLILLDLQMPGTGGMSVLEELRSTEKRDGTETIPVIIFTAMDADQSEVEFLKKNASVAAFMQKPITDYNEFITSIKEHLKA